jgi:hypothetical protein
VSEGIFTSLVNINGNYLAARQWAMGDLLNNANLYSVIADAKSYPSVKFIEMGFITEIEITQSGCDVAFTPEVALFLFN